MNRIFLNSERLVKKLFIDSKGKHSMGFIRLSIYGKTQSALAFYSMFDESIYFHGYVLKKHYSNECELIKLLVKLLSHEYFHHILFKQEGKITTQLFDRDWIGEKLEDYGILSIKETIKLYILHNTFIY